MCTFAKIGGELLIDPSLEEEEIMGARLSIGMTEDGSICAMQKGGAATFKQGRNTEGSFHCKGENSRASNTSSIDAFITSGYSNSMI